MTFYEAAISVLEREGKPLHFKLITEKAVTEKLLSHVGKDPEVTMFHRLSAMARRKGDRRVVATEPGTFGLLDWGVIEDPTALEATVLPVPDETELPLRPRERHPAPSRDNVRVSGRGGDRGRKGREEREGRRRLQPLPELCFEALSHRTDPITAVDLAATLRDQEKVNEDLGADGLLNALREDNRRRQSQDRRPLFIIGANGELSLDRAGAPGEGVPMELQAAFAQALGVPLEGKTPGGDRPRAERMGPGAQRLASQAREHQRNIGRVVRRRFGDLELGAVELVTQGLLESMGFKDVRVAKRTRESATFTGRRRDGLLDAKYAVRAFKGAREIGRQEVGDLRKDLASHGAQVGVIFGSGDAHRDARTEAGAAGALLLLWCGDALAEKLLERKIGTTSVTIEIPDLDEGFFRRVRDQGEIEDRRREERRVERESADLRDRAPKAGVDAPNGSAPDSSSSSSGEASPAESPAPEGVESAQGAVAPSGSAIEVRIDLSQPVPAPEPEHSPEGMATALASQTADAPVEPSEAPGASKPGGEGSAEPG